MLYTYARWNGFGGKPDHGESMDFCAARELEVGSLELESFDYHLILGGFSIIGGKRSPSQTARSQRKTPLLYFTYWHGGCGGFPGRCCFDRDI